MHILIIEHKMKKKKEDWDNGMTIAKMDGNELPSYRRAIYSGRPKRDRHSVKRDNEEIICFIGQL